MQHIVFFGFLILAALLYAMIEIQIEGAHGWAANLPTWRIDTPLTRMLLSGKPLTGYHVCFFLFTFTMVHLPYAMFFIAPTLSRELVIFAFFILFLVVEDFLWFVLNPAYGIRKFSSSNIWWHAHHWWWFMPRDYWIFIPIALLMYYLGNVL